MEPRFFANSGDEDGTFVPFTDILFNALLGFAFMVFIAFTLINPEAKTGTVDIQAEMIITVNWPDEHPDDIDTYLAGKSPVLQEVLALSDGLLLTTSDGNTARLAAATVNLKEGRLEGDGAVEIASPRGTIRAGAIDITDGGAMIRFTGGVRITVAPAR